MEGGIMHIKKVLVPVDFSPPSTQAINHAISLARKFQAKLFLLHVVEPSSALLAAFPDEGKKVETQRREQAERVLSALVASEDQDDLDLEIIVKFGEIEEEISLAIREAGADLVVMGTHGRRLFGRWLIGSVTQHMLRKMSVPVLTVCHVSRPLSFKRILFATDLSETSTEGFRFALDLASMTGSDLVVAHVIDKRPQVTYETPEVAAVFDEEQKRALEATRATFAEFESEGKRRNVRIEVVLSEGVAAEALPRIADENMVDFMIIPVRRKGRLERVLLGSTAEPVIREAHVPVLSIPIAVDENRKGEHSRAVVTPS
jgi:nucleotide-binding universal stress UspA family protein